MSKFLLALAILAGSAFAQQCPPLDQCSEYGTRCQMANNPKFQIPGAEPSTDGSALHIRNVPTGRTWEWLPKAQGESYCSYVMARGGWRPYVFSAYGLPKGLKIDPEHGLISGIVQDRPGVYDVTLTVTDAKKNVATARARLTILAKTVGLWPSGTRFSVVSW